MSTRLNKSEEMDISNSDRFPLINGYQINQQIYADSQTLVYRGIRLADEQPVILKTMRSDRPAPQDMLRLSNHYTIANNLNFTGIVQPIALEVYGKRLVLVMPDYGYIALSEYIEDNYLTLIEVLAIGRQLTYILEELYRQCVIHKDIKLSNILINPSTKQIKLTDFGLSTRLHHETPTIVSTNVLDGTLAYMAPEQTGRMNRGIDYRSDFYALGVTLFELLTGQLPYSSDDPLEIVHCLLAKPAPLVCELNPDIPNPIAQIVAKLLAKNAEDRYQSAFGLRHDLETALYELNQTGTIIPFEIATRDISDRFLISERLYGREVEVQALLNAFDRVYQGSSELMLVAGFSGIGKTMVVNEVHKPIAQKHGYFIKGKFEQFNRNIPFSALIQAFRNLMEQLQSESDAQLNTLKAKILEAVGENGRVIIEFIPELERIIGYQPSVPELSPNAAQNRFNLLFQQFIQVFTTSEPLVIFLDDLQWADLASLQLLKLLMQNVGHLLIVAAYRDNEVSSSHPFTLMIRELEKIGISINTIVLQPLIQADINQLVADTLRCDRALAKPLTELVYQKTKGNPFFATQFLKALFQDGLIYFQAEVGYWQCDISKIKLQSLTDDVVEFMTEQLQKLSQSTQDILKLAACIGTQFDLQTLGIASKSSETAVNNALWQSLQDGLIIPLNQIYKFFQEDLSDKKDNSYRSGILDSGSCSYQFLHDRVQQAAYSMIPESQKEAVHLDIGRLLLKRTLRNDNDKSLFHIVNQLNRGISLIHAAKEREELAHLNWRVGEKARLSSAYDAAMNYLNTGLQLLSTHCWRDQYGLSLGLHQLAAEVAYLSGAFTKMGVLIEIGLKNAKNQLDRAKFYEIQTLALVAQNQARAAVDYARTILPLFGAQIPQKLSKLQTSLGFLTTLYRMTGKTPKDLLSLPPMSDPSKLAACHLFNAIGAAAQSGIPEILPFITFNGISMYLRYGNIPKSSMAYTIYAFLLCEKLGQVDNGYAIGKAAIALCHQLNSKAALAPTLFLWNRFIAYRKESLSNTLPILLEAYQVSLEVGDIEYAAYSLCVYFFQAYLTGMNLIDLYREAIASRPDFEKLQQGAMIAIHNLNCQGLENLTTETNDVCQLVGRYFDETNIDEGDRQLQVNMSCRKLQLAFLFYRYEMALEQSAIIEKLVGIIDGTISKTLFYFYDALVRLAIYPLVNKSKKRDYLKKVKTAHNHLLQIAKSAPMNYQHKLLLLKAEQLRVLGKASQAISLYDLAIAGAKENGYMQEEALANELAAKFYLEWGKEKIAQVYAIESYYCYVRWGAKAKVNDLEKRYPQLLAPILLKPYPSNLSKRTTVQSSGSDSEAIDLVSLIKASQAISQEIEFDKLLATLLNIAIANAGADKCVLLLQVEQELQIAALVESGQQPQILSSPISLDLSEDIAISLANKVKRSLQPLVLSDARQDTQFASDRYILKHQPKSVLCTPILKQGQLLGILYLENSLTVGAFTSDRLEVLNLICTQVAISLETAQLFSESQQSAIKLQQSNAFLEAQRESSPDGILVIDENRRVSTYNQRFSKLWGIPQKILDTKDDYQLLRFVLDSLDQPEEFLKKVEYLYQHPNETSFDEICLKDGRVLERTSTTVKSSLGDPYGRIWCFRDISDRKRAEAALKASEAELRGLFLGMDDVVLVMDRAGTYQKIAPTNPNNLYLPAEELIGRKIEDFFSPEQTNQFLLTICQTLKTQRTLDTEYSIVIQDKEHFFSAKCSPLNDQSVIWVARDVSDRKATEAQLQQQSQQLANYSLTLEQKVAERTEELSQALSNLQATQRELIHSEKMAVLGQLTASIAHEINTPLGVIRSATNNVVSALNVSLQKLPDLLQNLSPQQKEEFLELVKTSRQNQQTISTKAERQLRKQFELLLEADGIDNFHNIAIQLTLLQANPDLQPYQSILKAANCDEILEVAYNMVLQHQSTSCILQEVDRAAKIVFALKTYSHQRQSEEKSSVQLRDSIEIALTLYQNRLKQGIELIRNYGEVPDILGNSDELTQVWVNLIDNAIYAIGQQGQLEISITQQEGRVVVEITDSGDGIPEELLTQLFEPFFTTKPRGAGSGLGLDIVRQIVHKHDGDIQVRSQKGRTTFLVILPTLSQLKSVPSLESIDE